MGNTGNDQPRWSETQKEDEPRGHSEPPKRAPKKKTNGEVKIDKDLWPSCWCRSRDRDPPPWFSPERNSKGPRSWFLRRKCEADNRKSVTMKVEVRLNCQPQIFSFYVKYACQNWDLHHPLNLSTRPSTCLLHGLSHSWKFLIQPISRLTQYWCVSALHFLIKILNSNFTNIKNLGLVEYVHNGPNWHWLYSLYFPI